MIRWTRRLRVLAGMTIVSMGSGSVAHAAPFHVGDIFAAVGDSNLDGTSEVRRYSSAGALQETLNLTGASGLTTGMAFDGSGTLYATAFSANLLKTFDKTGVLLGNFGSGYSMPESIVFDSAGHVYVSSVGGAGIKKFDAAGNLLATYISGTRVDWMDLAADQTTMFYTQELSAISRVDVSTEPGTSLPDFVNTGAANSFALRILPGGSVLVANGGDIRLFDASANLVRTYDVTGEDLWFAVNVTPDGTSFWSGNLQTGNLYQFDIACGGVSACTTTTGFIATGVPNQQPTRALAGVAIFGERTVASTTTTTSTTSTTIPTGCAAAASFASIDCRLDALIAQVRRQPTSVGSRRCCCTS